MRKTILGCLLCICGIAGISQTSPAGIVPGATSSRSRQDVVLTSDNLYSGNSVASTTHKPDSSKKETQFTVQLNPLDSTDVTFMVNNCDDRLLTIKIYDGKKRECYRKNVRVSESGSVAVKLEAAAFLPTGTYSVTATGKKIRYSTKLAIKN